MAAQCKLSEQRGNYESEMPQKMPRKNVPSDGACARCQCQVSANVSSGRGLTTPGARDLEADTKFNKYTLRMAIAVKKEKSLSLWFDLGLIVENIRI